MTEEPVPIDDLLAAREALIAQTVGGMPDAHRRFLISFERGAPAWDILALNHASALPAVRWRQQNLDKLALKARTKLAERLEEVPRG